MSNPNGSIVEPADIVRVATAGSTVGPDDGTQGGNFKPEIISGIDTDSPDRIKIPGDTPGGGTSDNGGNYTGKRRGRKPGSVNRKSSDDGATKESVRLESFEIKDILLSLHAMGAGFFNVSELALEPDEAEKLAAAIEKVAKYHAMSLDPKKAAYLNLAFVAGGIYGVRFMAIRARMKSEARPRVVPTPIKQEPEPEPHFDPAEFHRQSLVDVGG